MAQSQQPPAPPQLTYYDRPEVSETFIDSMRRAWSDGMNLRIEFTVNRIDDQRPAAPPTGQMVTACRIVMPLPSFLAIIQQLSGLASTIQTQAAQQNPNWGRTN